MLTTTGIVNIACSSDCNVVIRMKASLSLYSLESAMSSFGPNPMLHLKMPGGALRRIPAREWPAEKHLPPNTTLR
jgi:hypothetical protein